MNSIYKALSNKLGGGDLALLKETQRSWLAFHGNDEQVFLKVAKLAKDDERKVNYLPEALRDRSDELSSIGVKAAPVHSKGEKPVTAVDADLQLNKTYQECLAVCPQELIPKMKEIQAQWIVYRDLQRKTDAAVRHAASPDAVLRDLTLHRNTQLTHYLMLFVPLALPVGNEKPEDSSTIEKSPDIFRFAK